MGQEIAQTAGDDAQTRVFLSYSRKDAALVQRVAEGLSAAGFFADFDQAAHDPGNVSAGIAAEDEWWKRLQEMIASADVMVFLVSPDSAASAVCDEEIAYARALGKRILAVLARPVDFAKAPPRLSALNVRIDFSEGGPGFDGAMAALVSALSMNVGWHRNGRKYFARVQEWDAGGRPKSRLLREGAVEEAERWALARPRNEPEPGEMFLAWIAASRAQIKRDAAVRAFWRRVTGLFVVTTLAAVLVGAWFVVRGQRNLGRSESLMLARTSEQFAEKKDYVRALQLAILASRDSFLSPTTDEAKGAFAKSAQMLRLVSSVETSEDPDAVIANAVPVAQGRSLLVRMADDTVGLWSLETGRQIAGPFRQEDGGNGGQFSVSKNGELALIYWGAVAYGVNTLTGAAFGPIRSDADAYPSFGLGIPFADGSKFLLRDQKDGFSLRDGVTGERIGTLAADAGMAFDALISEDGRTALLVSEAGQRFWNLERGAPIGELEPFAQYAQIKRVLSPDGSRLVTGGLEDGVHYRDTATGQEIALGSAPMPGLSDAVFVPEMNRLVTVDGQRNAQVWDMTTGEPVGEPQRFDPTVEGLAASVDGGMLISISYLSGVSVVSLETGEVLSAPAEGGTPSGVVLVPSRKGYLSWDGRRVQFNIPDELGEVPEDLVTEHPGYIEDVVPSPDGNSFLTYTSEGEVRQWETETGRLLSGPYPHTNYESRGGFVADGSKFVTVEGARAFVWAARDFSTAAGPERVEGEPARDSLLSPDGRFELVWNDFGLGILWDVAGQKAVGPGIIAGERGFWGAAFDPGGEQMALWFENQLQLIPTATGIGKDTLMEHEDLVARGAFTQDGTRLVTVDASGMVRIWDTATLTAVGEPILHEAYDIPQMDIIRKRMVVFEGSTASLVDVQTGAVIGAPVEHGKRKASGEEALTVLGAAISGNGDVAVSYNSDEVRLLDAATGAARGGVIAAEEAPYGVALSADGKRLIVFLESRAEVFDTESGALVQKLAEGRAVQGGALSDDGSVAVTWDRDAMLRLWNTGTGAQIGNTFQTGLVEQEARFTPDGKRLMLVEPSGAFRLVDVTTGDVILQLEQAGFGGGYVWRPEAGELLTARFEGDVRTWDVSWAMRTGATPADVAGICAEKLQGTLRGDGTPFVRKLDDAAITKAPILRGREGEDVCTAPVVPWWETAAGVVFGWMFR